jgi:hypothetical protein
MIRPPQRDGADTQLPKSHRLAVSGEREPCFGRKQSGNRYKRWAPFPVTWAGQKLVLQSGARHLYFAR